MSAPEADVIVVHCSDARYQPHVQEFLRRGLGLERYSLLAVPGGPQFLTLAEYLPKFSWVGWRWMKFLVNLSRPRRVILIGHDDCRWYLDARFLPSRERIGERQLADLRQVRAAFVERFPAVAVEAYFARLDGDAAVFDALA
ncbi:MAG: hypothetical protein IMZ67_00085 [Acidobacteria bacterium]|nr:hypothetical protein [Acidobacteriota bacterium]